MLDEAKRSKYTGGKNRSTLISQIYELSNQTEDFVETCAEFSQFCCLSMCEIFRLNIS